MELESLGWSPSWAHTFEPFAHEGLDPGRVRAGQGRVCRVSTAGREVLAEVVGKLRHRARGPEDLPVVGDWVALRTQPTADGASIHAVLPRRSHLSRKAAGARTDEQIVAANVDVVFLVVGLDRDFNPRRVERALVLARESGADPVVILNKADICDAVPDRQRAIEAIATDAPVHPLSAATGEGLDALEIYLRPGRTAVLLGSSGVGKSTIVNRLLREDRQHTQPVRAHDDRGRHTTTHRELIVLPGGGLIIDTPGIRELQLWTEGAGLDATFADIDTLSQSCAFRDCRHLHEPRCAVLQAIAEGTLPADRLASYRKLEAEQRHFELGRDQRARLEQKKRWKRIHKAARGF